MAVDMPRLACRVESVTPPNRAINLPAAPERSAAAGHRQRWAHSMHKMRIGRWYVVALAWLCLWGTSALAADCGLELEVTALTNRVDASEWGMVPGETLRVILRNKGKEALTLVRPGAGSSAGWRTPILTWEVELHGGVYEEPSLWRCGNINPLRPGEVFEFAPGAMLDLSDQVPGIYVDKKGVYSVALRFQNDPTLEWGGIPLGKHDEAEMERVRHSSSCVVRSNVISFEVSAVRGQE